MSLELIADRIALQDLMLNYAAAVDERDIERYGNCFAEDVEVLNFGDSIINGKEEWVAYVWEALTAYSSTQHLLAPQLATITGDTAQTRSDVQALHYFAEPEANGPTRFILWATYNTAMTRVGSEWKIQRHELIVRGSSAD